MHSIEQTKKYSGLSFQELIDWCNTAQPFGQSLQDPCTYMMNTPPQKINVTFSFDEASIKKFNGKT